MNYLYDKKFLKKLCSQRHRDIYARITLLTLQDELPIERVEGKITGGTINLDGASAVRRSCSLTMVTQDQDIHEYYWALKTKFKLEIGVSNNTGEYANYSIIWIPQGTYLISQFSIAMNTTQMTLNISGKDKMCQLNGEMGGVLAAQTDFGQIEEYDKNGNRRITKIPVKQIIKELVHTYAGESYARIIIEDIDDYGLNLETYRGNEPIYLFFSNLDSSKPLNFTFDGNQKVSYDNTVEKLKNIPNEKFMVASVVEGQTNTEFSIDGQNYHIRKIEYGQTVGYKIRDLVYPSDLIANAGETLISVLDKIKTMLGPEFEYYYDTDSCFYFKRQQAYVSNNLPIIVDGVQLYSTTQPIEFTFDNLDLIISMNNNPTIQNVKNDFTVWGARTAAGGGNSTVPIHARYVIDEKPVSYTKIWINEERANILLTNYPELFSIHAGETEDTAKDRLVNAHPKKTYTSTDYDWRELIYQMALDYRQFNQIDEFPLWLSEDNDWVKDGKTGYERYYIDLEGFWRQLYQKDPNQYKHYNRFEQDQKYIYDNNELIYNDQYIYINNQEKIDDEVLYLRENPNVSKLTSLTDQLPEYEGNTNKFTALGSRLESANSTRGENIDFWVPTGFKKIVSGTNTTYVFKKNLIIDSVNNKFIEENWKKILQEIEELSFAVKSHQECVNNCYDKDGKPLNENVDEYRDLNNDLTHYEVLLTIQNDYKTTLEEYLTLLKNINIASRYTYTNIGKLSSIIQTNYKILKCAIWRQKLETLYSKTQTGSISERKIAQQKLDMILAAYPQAIQDSTLYLMDPRLRIPSEDNADIWIDPSGKNSHYIKFRSFYQRAEDNANKDGTYSVKNIYLNLENTLLTLDERKALITEAYNTTNFDNGIGKEILTNLEVSTFFKQYNSIEGRYTFLDFYLKYDTGFKKLGKYYDLNSLSENIYIINPNGEDNWIDSEEQLTYTDEANNQIVINYLKNNKYQSWGITNNILQNNKNNKYFYRFYDQDNVQQLLRLQFDLITDTIDLKYYKQGYLKDGNYIGWNENVINNPETLNFWFDMIDDGGTLSKYSVKNIGAREKVTNNNLVKVIKYLNTPNIIFMESTDEIFSSQERTNKYFSTSPKTGYVYFNLGSDHQNYLSISSNATDAITVIENQLYNYAQCSEQISITCIPQYFLTPNIRIQVYNPDIDATGTYIVSKLTIPLAYNGTMSLTATKALEEIITREEITNI